MNIKQTITDAVSDAMFKASGEKFDPQVNYAGKPQFGDYQANGCMTAAKKLKCNPREFAQKVLANLDLGEMAGKVEIAGAGFINIFLSDEWLVSRLGEMVGDERLGAGRAADGPTVVVDYSGPNLAKEMHVGHLRSTIIGDALARVLEFLGNRVVRQNHVGDWGTQFGMLLAHMHDMGEDSSASLSDLEGFYRDAKKRFDEDEDFARRARETVVALQGGDESCRAAWKRFLDISLGHCQQVYDKLGVGLDASCVRGESSYNDDLPEVVNSLDAEGLLSESQGARGVFLNEFTNKENEPAFVIVQKSDGGYLYATTDLAALRYRNGRLHAARILYVTDSRQAQHFAQVFTIARKAGFVDEKISLEHVPFGMMLGNDGRPFKTRTGGTVKLMELIEEARARAAELVRQKNPEIAAAELEKIADVVGIGALKYADLSQNRASDYVFAWNKMLSLEGNTAPYMQYAYARVKSIFRKGGLESTAACRFILADDVERTLGVKLLQFGETLDAVAAAAMPNILCAYLFELAGAFMSFYEKCPVLKADDAAVRVSRLALCDLTAGVIRQGLQLLGIATLEQM